MRKANQKPAGKARTGYTKADMQTVSENPEWTARDFAKAKPFAEVFSELSKTIKRGRPPIGAKTKTLLSLRLDEEVVTAYRKTGSGWQSRINKDLRKARGL